MNRAEDERCPICVPTLDIRCTCGGTTHCSVGANEERAVYTCTQCGLWVATITTAPGATLTSHERA